jgi:quercetin dioxygenase-like cupin family protein
MKCCIMVALAAALAIPVAYAGTSSSLPAQSVLSAKSMVIFRSGSQASIKAPGQNFVGSVRIDPLLIQPQIPSKVSAAYVTFEPGAHSAWHTHPLGQLLIITAGSGWVQQEGSEKQLVRAGDVIWTPPGVKHWHGATATTSMTHIAIQESVDGKNVIWLESVSAQQYHGDGT